MAVYSYPKMDLQTVIKDDRTSYIGRYFTKGFSVDENGDVYAFSSAIAIDDNAAFNSTKPSAVTRINDGEIQFDSDYFFDLEEASGGEQLSRLNYDLHIGAIGGIWTEIITFLACIVSASDQPFVQQHPAELWSPRAYTYFY